MSELTAPHGFRFLFWKLRQNDLKSSIFISTLTIVLFVFSGLLEKCFNAFYDSEVVSEEAFEEWVNSKDPEEQEGKGVCITSVQNFMRWLKEADEEG